MWFTDWLHALRQLVRGPRRKAPRRQPRRARDLTLEGLEERMMLTKNVYLDFGVGLMRHPGTAIQTNVAQLIEIDGTASTGPNLRRTFGASDTDLVVLKP